MARRFILQSLRKAVTSMTWAKLRDLKLLLTLFLWAAAVPLLAWAFGVFFLLVPPQTQDLITNATLLQTVLYFVAVAGWAVSCWFWTRWSLGLQPVFWPERLLPPNDAMTDCLAPVTMIDRPGSFLRRWIARAPLLCSAPVAMIPLVRSHRPLADLVLDLLVLVAIEALLLAAASYRQQLPAVLRRDMNTPLTQVSPDGIVSWTLCLDLLPFGRWSFLVWVVGFVGLCAAMVYWPVALPNWLGAPAVSILALSVVGGVVAFLSVILRRRTGLPGLVVIIGWAALVGDWNPNHAIRTLETAPSAVDALPGQTSDALHRTVDGRPILRDVLEGGKDAKKGWLDWCDRDPLHPQMVVVATAGGASRAALWTASVLHAAEQLVGPRMFRKALFGISGVSGGSLGAAAYVAGLPPQGCAAANDDPRTPTASDVWTRTRSALATSFVGVPIAAFLTTDVLSRLIPFWSVDDRAASLEKAWETAWRGAWAGTTVAEPQPDHTADLDHGFLPVWMAPGDAWNGSTLPLLFLNGTHADLGLTIVTAPIKITPDVFPAAIDLLAVVGRDIRWSTAVLNSARFPVVSPGGILLDRGENREYRGIVMDGGYVENFGADTARDLVRAIEAWRWRKEASGNAQFVPHVLVIQISSDPSFRRNLIPRCGPLESVPIEHPEPIALSSLKPPPQILSDLLGPLMTVVEARGARGARTASDLQREKCPRFANDPVEYVHFALCDEDIPGHGSQNDVINLNWALRDEAVAFLAPDDPDKAEGTAFHACGNDEEITKLRQWFERTGKQTTGAAPAAGGSVQ